MKPGYNRRSGRIQTSGYTDMVLRASGALMLSLLLMTACESEQQKKEKIQQAILDRLGSHSGLDLKALDVTTTAVSFEKNKAYATVSFHPKGDPSVNGGMVMKYTLEQHDGKWQVTGVGNSQGAANAHPNATQPSVPTQPGLGDGSLPAGHPSVGPAK